MSEKQHKPSEWLKIRQENKGKSNTETKLLLKQQEIAEAKPFIENIMKWLSEPKELKAYLSYFPNDKNIDKAISLIKVEEPYKSILAENQNKDSVIILSKYQVSALSQSVREIQEQENQSQKIESSEINKYNFSKMKKHLSELFSYESQLEYLVNIKADYLQERINMPRLDHLPEFNELCDAEITRIKELINIAELSGIPRNLSQLEEKIRQTSSVNLQADTKEVSAKQNDFNLAHKVHTLLYLLKNSGVNINEQGMQAEIARFIQVITNQNYKNIYDLVRSHGFDEKKSKETHKKELRKVRDKFVSLKSNLQRNVQNDLERLERRNNE
jgi:hypothetical protein